MRRRIGIFGATEETLGLLRVLHKLIPGQCKARHQIGDALKIVVRRSGRGQDRRPLSG